MVGEGAVTEMETSGVQKAGENSHSVGLSPQSMY